MDIFDMSSTHSGGIESATLIEKF